MLHNFSRRVELLANIAIISVSILIGVVIVKNYLAPRSQPPAQRLTAGTKLPLRDVDWAGNGQTLLVVLQKGCHFCSESAPFYQRLAGEASGLGAPRLVAVLPQGADEAKGYLSDLNVPIQEVRQARLSDIGVMGTPTLILVNGKGEVIDSWVGKLPPEKESEVLRRAVPAAATNKGG